MLISVVCSVVKANNALKHSQKLEIMMQRKSGGKFRRVGPLSFDGINPWSF